MHVHKMGGVSILSDCHFLPSALLTTVPQLMISSLARGHLQLCTDCWQVRSRLEVGGTMSSVLLINCFSQQI